VVAAAYLVAGTSINDAFAHSFAAVSTGGFSPHNRSIAHFESAAIEWVTISAMFIAGGSFALYYRVLRGDRLALWRSAEFRAYTAIVLASTFVVFVVADTATGWSTHARDSLFAITSITSTTGFGTADFATWSDGAQIVLLLLMPIGAMAGSTAGGVKVVRVLAVASYAHRAALRQLHPRLVRPVRVGLSTVSEEVAARILGFLVMALVVFGGGALLITLTGVDMITAFSAAASSFGNVGPGLGEVGPASDYLTLPRTARLVTMAQMVLGRLEIYPVILAFSVITLRRRLRPLAD
jgi:trk system potassium uptake protein TrkH